MLSTSPSSWLQSPSNYLDIFVHPNVSDLDMGALVSAVVGSEKVKCVVDATGRRASLLKSLGWHAGVPRPGLHLAPRMIVTMKNKA
mmetsp:Transcript_30358/g.71333  ORF Transcript_30358/g.71333 Transcript_30358/m.71333 type:complete len:86 (-) Transcript_30358:102-359(-)